MRFYDYVRTKPDEKMRELAKRLGVELLHGLKGVKIAENPSEAKRYVGRARVVFTPRVDEALLSLAQQSGTFLGLFVGEISPHRLGRYAEWVRLSSKSRVPVLLATGARDPLEMRAPRDIARIGILLGMRREDAFAAVSRRWRVILEAH